MLSKEKKYDFRKRMLQIHKPNIRDYELFPKKNEFVIADRIVLEIPGNAGLVVETAAKDFREYLEVSMGISMLMRKYPEAAICSDDYKKEQEESVIQVFFAEKAGVDLRDVAGYMGYQIEVGENIVIYGYDERGIAQAFYRFEEMMNLRRAPYIAKVLIKIKQCFHRAWYIPVTAWMSSLMNIWLLLHMREWMRSLCL